MDSASSPRSHTTNGDSAPGIQLPHERRVPSLDAQNTKLAAASSATQQDLRSVGEFAQEHLFSHFQRQANEKINHYMSLRSADLGEYIEKHFGPGYDPKFDQLLTAIGHSASRNPSSFIDKVTLWHREVIEGDKDSTRPGDASHSQARERKTSLAIYLLCRALLEILRQTSSHPLARPELDRLEKLIYEHHFRSLCLDTEVRPTAVQAKWDMTTQVTTSLFELDFEAMAGRVIRDLKMYQKALGVKGNNDLPSEINASQLLRGLRYIIKLQCATDIGWSRSCNFVQAIADLFNDVHGQQAKESYCRFIGNVLLPVAASGRKDFSQLQWKKLVSSMNERISQLVGKPKYWTTAFPAQSILACVSPDDLFMKAFQAAVQNLPVRLRERNNRAHALKSLCRLLWVYVNRIIDKPEIVTDTLRNLGRAVFFANRRYSLSKELAIAEPLVYFIRIIGHARPELCFRDIIFPLLQSELILNSKDPTLIRPEQLDPDRSVIGIRAFLAILSDLELQKAPTFPVRFEDERKEDVAPWTQTSSGDFRQSIGSPLHSPASSSTDERQIQHPVATAVLNETTKEFFLHFCSILHRIVLVSDAGFGGQAAIDDKYATIPVPKTPITGNFPRAGKDEAASILDDKKAFFELLQNGIRALPRCLGGRSPVPILGLLCNDTAHVDLKIATASMDALKSIAKQGHGQVVIDKFSTFLLSYDNRCSVVSAGGTLGDSHLERTLGLYVELLKIWNNDLAGKMPELASVPQTQKENEARNAQFGTSDTWTQVDRAECQALFFLCSPSSRVRDHAVQLLDLVAKLDTALGHSNSRIISVLRSNSEEILKPSADNLTTYERSILQRDLMNGSENSTLITLCCSDHAEGQVLWYKVFPRFLEAAFKACPVAVTQTREDVCNRLGQMAPVLDNLDKKLGNHHFNASIDMTIAKAGRNAPILLTETLCTQWKAYLLFVCKTLTKPGLRVPAAQASAGGQENSNHVRKSSKSSQSTAESSSLTTGAELFSKVVPFLFAEFAPLREATVIGIGNTGFNLLRPLLESLETQGRAEDRKRPFANHQRAASSPRRHQVSGFSGEVAHVHKLVAHYLEQDSVREDEWIMDYFSTYTKDLCMFLHQTTTSDTSKLRLHFCGLVEQFWRAVILTDEPDRWMQFQTRRSAFANMESWTGIMPSPEQPRPSENQFQQVSPREQSRPPKPSYFKLSYEIKTAALSSMAALCVS